MSGGDRPYVGALPPPIPPERKQLLDLLYQKAEVPRSANEAEGVNVACFVDAVTRSCPFRRLDEPRLLVITAHLCRDPRSEERRVGKECGSTCRFRVCQAHSKKHK